MNTIKIGTRKSPLAQYQADCVIEALQRVAPQYNYQKVCMHTEGDYDQTSDLRRIGGQGVFVKYIQSALLEGDIDIAVHSAKDMPSISPKDLSVAGCLSRGDVSDTLITKQPITSVHDLRNDACIATGSVRRQIALKASLPNVHCDSLRGNIATRLNKLQQSTTYDGIMMATAALQRLDIALDDYGLYGYTLPVQAPFLPAVGQGIIAMECRNDDTLASELLHRINDNVTYQCLMAERAFLAVFGAGCNVPLAAYAQYIDDNYHMTAMIGDLAHGTYHTVTASHHIPDVLGKMLGEQLKGCQDYV